MKFLKWFFNFGKKYKKREEEYHRKSKKFGTSGEILTILLYTALPLLSLWGAFKISWGATEFSWVLKLFCIAGCLSIFTLPSDIMITAIVALRHRLRMKVQNKVEDVAIEQLAETISGQEMTDEQKQKLEDDKARGTAPKYDLAVGILGIICSVAVVIAFVTLFFVFCYQGINALQ